MSLRRRKNRRYNETNDEENDGFRKFDLQHQIKTDRFDQIRDKHLQEFPGEEVTLRLFQKHGFEKPILVKKPDGLDLRVPPKSFLVRDVRNYVGHQRIIDVMDVKTQKNIEMSMKDWCKYYESKNRDRLLNVISLEFSHTKLAELVEAPLIVRLMDWVDLVWPKFLKQGQTESTNTITKMMYPKVQKYCLMSVKGSYTDFHIDFGGTSVWYHILRGRKIFWMVPPTELNLQIFEEWTLSGMQQDVFFGDTVEECFRVELSAGHTFFIPSGWIHAVYTLEDSLVFGGNFLHSFGIENQLKVSKIEDSTKVPLKFRYPFYTEILWYVVQHYVYCLMNKDHLHQQEVMKAVESTKAALEQAKATSAEIEDESSETEIEEIESKPQKKSAKAIKRRKAPVKAKKGAKTKKAPTPSSTDDESTEVDTDIDEPCIKKQQVATCRMTKNSLLRLQYEVDEQLTLEKPNQSPTKVDEISTSKNQAKKIKTEQSPQQASIPPSTLNLAEFALSDDSKRNGWTNNGSQSNGPQSHAWSVKTSEPPEVRKIHITKYELSGLKVLQAHLSKLSKAKKNLPTLIRNSRALLDDCRKLISEHENDDPELAVTGIPVTPELLNTPKKADINELIEQFFKTTETTDKEDSASKRSVHHPAASDSCKSRPENSQIRSRQGSLSTDLKGSESSNSAGNKNCEADMIESPTKSQKETKCLSPNKKMMNLSASFTHASTSATTERPKSPPTRPLSMNQYSSKTKNTQSNSNLLLPGSFADLIAATSTEKVFDVSGADVTSSLFGSKNLSSATNKPSNATQSTSGSKERDKVNKLDPSNSSPSKLSQVKSASSPDPPTASSISGTSKDPSKLPNSANQSSPQKRFIIPNQFKPPNKEKLIYASAPYVSPINSSNQSRTGNPYPWQTPARTPEQSRPYNPINQRPSLSSQAPENPNPPAINRPRSPSPSKLTPTIPSQLPAPITPQVAETSGSPDKVREQTETLETAQREFVKKQALQQNLDIKSEQMPSVNRDALPTESKPSSAPSADSSDQSSTKKPHKPRGPPKKSKEARQILDNQLDTKPPFIPISVIKAGPSSAAPIEPASTSLPPKTKPKRSKKQKNDMVPPNQPVPQSVIKSPQTQAPVICGLVTQPNKTSNQSMHKIGPQPYLLTRPFLFNPLTAAQYQQMHRAPTLPLFTSPMVSGSPTLGSLPFQQGARIVWATQPRLSTPVSQATSSQSISAIRNPTSIPKTVAVSKAPKTLAPPPSVPSKLKTTVPTLPTTSHSDNAALLSLATTALSTASMVPAPTLSHLSHLMPGNQAIVVSSAGGNPIFAGQQYLRPAFLPGVPTAHFVNQPGLIRPPTTGQLVFARLPNQNQQRYLITQPGFMQQRFPAPHIATSQPASTLAYAAFRPPTESPKELKTKKVKTS